MTLADEYRRQFGWRSWGRALDALPPLRGKTVLDLGCAVGDLSAELAARGARVVGIDLNDELLAVARARGIPNAEFRVGDLRAPVSIGEPVDGVWSSFAAAYFVDLPRALADWTRELRSAGFVALIEIDDLFAHEPVAAATRAAFDAYCDDALAKGRYDFRMGRRLATHLETAGFEVMASAALDDQEFSFDGPARADVLAAWRLRFDRMTLLPAFCGDAFAAVRDDFLASLSHPKHRSAARVQFALARGP